jgi:hypothetical protein
MRINAYQKNYVSTLSRDHTKPTIPLHKVKNLPMSQNPYICVDSIYPLFASIRPAVKKLWHVCQIRRILVLPWRHTLVVIGISIFQCILSFLCTSTSTSTCTRSRFCTTTSTRISTCTSSSCTSRGFGTLVGFLLYVGVWLAWYDLYLM